MDEEHTPSHTWAFEHHFVEDFPVLPESHFQHSDEEFIEHVHHHCHTDRSKAAIVHHYDTLPWWADCTNWTKEENDLAADQDILEEPTDKADQLKNMRPRSFFADLKLRFARLRSRGRERVHFPSSDRQADNRDILRRQRDYSESQKILQTRSVPTLQAPAYPFSKGTYNQKDVLLSIIRAEVSKSVGLIYIDGQPVGTGFRVGEKYLVTCGHVIQNVIKAKPHMLDGERLTIEFNRITHNQKENPLLIFGFQSLIAYFDDEHDFAVLELRCHDAGVPFPPALPCFADVSNSHIHLLGHPGGRQMKEDCVEPMWLPDHHTLINPYIDYLANWSKTYFPDNKDYYSVLRELPRKIMFHTTFDTGSSGSPGVIIRNNRPCVVVMVRGGTPSCFYENLYNLPVEDNHKVEYGYAMSDIHRKMFNSKQQNIRDLASEIFIKWM